MSFFALALSRHCSLCHAFSLFIGLSGPLFSPFFSFSFSFLVFLGTLLFLFLLSLFLCARATSTGRRSSAHPEGSRRDVRNPSVALFGCASGQDSLWGSPPPSLLSLLLFSSSSSSFSFLFEEGRFAIGGRRSLACLLFSVSFLFFSYRPSVRRSILLRAATKPAQGLACLLPSTYRSCRVRTPQFFFGDLGGRHD
ncbi:hypothetical protein C8J57DRAFT_1273638 [Mycena rebaudengoi]|nr:hypothetical protein C8J57DRAFT_1273638 [Mycena rebaudengoi]